VLGTVTFWLLHSYLPTINRLLIALLYYSQCYCSHLTVLIHTAFTIRLINTVIGQESLLILQFLILAKSCVFGKQSKCPLLCECIYPLLSKGPPFPPLGGPYEVGGGNRYHLLLSRTYKDILPNSLSTVLSSPSYISTRPLASDCYGLVLSFFPDLLSS
jgi:hypothetical protein